MTSTARYIVLAGLFLALASIPLTARVPNPHNSILLTQLHNCAHSLLFFAFHLLSLFVGRHLIARGFLTFGVALNITLASGLSFSVGLAIELIQPYVGRSASWGDVGRNSLGILAANGAFLAIIPEIRVLLIKITGALLVIGALTFSLVPAVPWAYAELLRGQAFPLLNNYDSPHLNRYVFAAAGAKVDILKAPALWEGNHSQVAKVVFTQGKTYPGMMLRNPVNDWSDYSMLVFDAYSPNPTAEVIAINIYSSEKGRRPYLHHKFVIEPGLGTYQLKLPERLSLQQHHITYAIWHALHPQRTTIMYFDEIRLE